MIVQFLRFKCCIFYRGMIVPFLRFKCYIFSEQRYGWLGLRFLSSDASAWWRGRTSSAGWARGLTQTKVHNPRSRNPSLNNPARITTKPSTTQIREKHRNDLTNITNMTTVTKMIQDIRREVSQASARLIDSPSTEDWGVGPSSLSRFPVPKRDRTGW